MQKMFLSVWKKISVWSRSCGPVKKLFCFLFLLLFLSSDGLCELNAGAAVKSFTSRPTVNVSPYRVYLSPSAQPWNPYCDGSGSEETYMRQIASAMIPYLKGYGIESVLAAPSSGGRAAQHSTLINRASQASYDGCDLYLAIHSNAQDGGPKTNGTTVYYPSGDPRSQRFADLLKDNFIYPDKSAVSTATNDALWEMSLPKMPHCLIETAYHDNANDAWWIENNTEAIAENLARCVAMAEYIPVDISVDRSSVRVKAGKTCELNSKVTLINRTTYYNQTSWSSNNSKVAAVRNGTVLGVSKGCTTVLAKTGNGLITKCLVTVA